MKDNKTLKIAVTGLMAALAYIAFTFLQIKIPTPGGTTSFHLGNTFCVLAALLLGGVPGGIAGAVGMGIGDLLDPTYVVVAPTTGQRITATQTHPWALLLSMQKSPETGAMQQAALTAQSTQTRTNITL